MYTKAIVRRPGKNFANGITTSNLGQPDFNKALEQHAAYCEALTKCGVELTVLDADERYPDGCFVEDTAVVNSRVKVISRPGAATRRGEEDEIARVLAASGPTESITAPGTLEGGDVLRAENHYYIGISERTNMRGRQPAVSHPRKTRLYFICDPGGGRTAPEIGHRIPRQWEFYIDPGVFKNSSPGKHHHIGPG